MKEFKSVSVKNFFSYGQQEQTLELSGKDIWNISGTNGKGKTTLCVEALTFAIYGKHREDKIDECVNRDVGKNCKVSLEFIGDDDKVYKIIRYRKHDTHGNSVYIFKENKDISCKNAKDTDELIQDLVGLPYIAFVNSTLFSSELYSNFLSAKNSERLVIFENILSLKEVTAFYAVTKEILKELDEQEERILIKKAEEKATADMLEKQITDYNTQAKTNLLKLKEQKEAAKEAIKAAAEELDALNVLDVESERAKLNNSELKKEYQKQINEKQEAIKAERIEEPTEEIALVNKYKDFDFAANKAKEEKYKQDSETIRNREVGYEKAKTQLEALKAELSSLESEKNKYVSDLSIQNKNMDSIKNAICPFCGQEMGKEETEQKRQSITAVIEQLNISISDVDVDINAKKLELKTVADTYNDLISDANRLRENLDKNFVSNSDLEEEKYKNALKSVELYNNKIESSKVKIDLLESEINDLKAKSDKIEISKYTEEYLNNIANNIQEKKDVIAEQERIIATIDGSVKTTYDKDYVEKMKKQLEEAKLIVDSTDVGLKDLQTEINHYKFLAECFSNKSGGFKKFFINEMIPMFNDFVNTYLPFFFGDKKVEVSFDKDLNDTIKVDGREVSFSSFSRGQKSRAEIAVAFALFSLSRVFFKNKSGLLVVDELLDNGLDELGIKASISVLDSFAKDSKVFVVSHNPVVKECIDNVIEVKTDDGGFSYIA